MEFGLFACLLIAGLGIGFNLFICRDMFWGEDSQATKWDSNHY